ncbi:LuxR C-terminal-related transcriptional regulator [Lacihabitans soyangensis]|jgi:DNA-binding CsgD family transcriptional regulator|uniref:LuxR family transcriptional regulator n=1 Tax=Lacihabitans soyangensis TaxID=869394 RepID=A0AAE3H6Z3_9BACT|nr:LuxR C-terminal-related transcriptional regulator [Lacihabitans soyangensis]MCP9765290.1 LuxR family transcriptional regulator [Lacihabitans soyangensis]
MNVLSPLSVHEFIEIAKNENEIMIGDFVSYFQNQIEEASNYAIGPYFWFIGDNSTLMITAASQNINELTPYQHEAWTKGNTFFFAENIHPDDRFFVLSAFKLAVEKIELLPLERQSSVRLNIYARMLNAKAEYRWVLIQMPRLYINEKDRTTVGFILVTDLSHLEFLKRPTLMTLTDKVNNQNQYFHIAEDLKELVVADLPNITKREQEIVNLMAKGLNSPAISEKLYLSYHTVENHKRNLRKKTNTKTSAELIDYVWRNNLI